MNEIMNRLVRHNDATHIKDYMRRTYEFDNRRTI